MAMGETSYPAGPSRPPIACPLINQEMSATDKAELPAITKRMLRGEKVVGSISGECARLMRIYVDGFIERTRECVNTPRGDL
jgi:hypothetical protein